MHQPFQRYKSISYVIGFLLLLIGCGSIPEQEGDSTQVNTVSQSLDAAHTRVINECSPLWR
jgi:hypothetical protein